MNRPATRGSALIEFAGSLILLSAAFAGIFQIGYTFYTYERLVNAVRAGARYASLRAGSVDSDQLARSVKNLVIYGDPAQNSAAPAIARGLEAANVDVTVRDHAATVAIRGYAVDSTFAIWKLDGRPTVTFPLANGAVQR
jgi:Flp pilus assembly protein TadG